MVRTPVQGVHTITDAEVVALGRASIFGDVFDGPVVRSGDAPRARDVSLVVVVLIAA